MGLKNITSKAILSCCPVLLSCDGAVSFLYSGFPPRDFSPVRFCLGLGLPFSLFFSEPRLITSINLPHEVSRLTPSHYYTIGHLFQAIYPGCLWTRDNRWLLSRVQRLAGPEGGQGHFVPVGGTNPDKRFPLLSRLVTPTRTKR